MVTDVRIKVQTAMRKDLDLRKKFEGSFVRKTITDWQTQLMA
jgi:hypothetical protein